MMVPALKRGEERVLRECQRRQGGSVVVVDANLPATNVKRLCGNNKLEPIAAVADDATEVRVGGLLPIVIGGSVTTIQVSVASHAVIFVHEKRCSLRVASTETEEEQRKKQRETTAITSDAATEARRRFEPIGGGVSVDHLGFYRHGPKFVNLNLATGANDRSGPREIHSEP
jgi:hypothetical protein